ncbi:HNH endonuclease, partial [Mycobacterium sp. ITM-2017-0098]
LLAELIIAGARIRLVDALDLNTEPRYRPSAALQRFVTTRDLTCRFPGCSRPAAYADIDHTQPWPSGATHPSNLKCYCRIHHLVKTFLPTWTD